MKPGYWKRKRFTNDIYRDDDYTLFVGVTTDARWAEQIVREHNAALDAQESRLREIDR